VIPSSSDALTCKGPTLDAGPSCLELVVQVANSSLPDLNRLVWLDFLRRVHVESGELSQILFGDAE
jgi:hypothetical protein